MGERRSGPVLGERVAQAVVDRVMERLGHNVNLMDTAGVIVASGEPSRVGTRHEGACRALARGAPEVVPEDAAAGLDGTQPGVNVPVSVDGEIVGVVGVTGAPEQVAAAASSVALTVELMLGQQTAQEEWEWRRRARGQLVEDLIAGRLDEGEWHRRLGMLGCAMSPPYAVTALVPDRTPVTVPIRSLHGADTGVLRCLDGHGTAWIVAGRGHHAVARARAGEARSVLDRAGVTYRTVESGRADTVRDLARLAGRTALAAGVLRARHRAETRDGAADHPPGDRPAPVGPGDGATVTLADLEVPVLLAGLAAEERRELRERVLGALSADQRRTLAAFLAADLVVTRAARDLVVHRNTLLQRLDAVTRITGRDPRRFGDAAAFHVALLLDELTDDA
ncbi:MAG: CdaR family transcriptional regulator [Kineosporiaceae bacterium]